MGVSCACELLPLPELSKAKPDLSKAKLQGSSLL